MFSKVALSTLAVGAISASALAVPVARAPQPESWSEWGTNIGNYYANKYGSPSDVPGLPQFKREPEPQETWGQWGEAIGDHYAAPWENSKRDEKSTAAGQVLGDFVKAILGGKREPSPGPETWEEWGTNIGNYYAGKYSDPSSVPGLPQFKREPEPQESWGQWGEAIGNHYAAPWENSKREPKDMVKAIQESLSTAGKIAGGLNPGNGKREPSPEPDTWEEWGTNIGNHYANKYGTPSQVPGLPRPRLNSRHEHHDNASPSSAPGDRHPGKDDHHHHHKGDHHHGHKSSKPEPSKTTTPTSTPTPKS